MTLLQTVYIPIHSLVCTFKTALFAVSRGGLKAVYHIWDFYVVLNLIEIRKTFVKFWVPYIFFFKFVFWYLKKKKKETHTYVL